MEIRIAAHGERAPASSALLEWLRREPELRGYVTARSAPAEPETMGVPVVIAVALLANSAVVALARSVRTWLEHRKPTVEVEFETSRGHLRYKLADDTSHDSSELVRKLTELIDEP